MKKVEVYIIYNKQPMKFFQIIVEMCITAIQYYSYSFADTDIKKQMKLACNSNNKYDSNAIKVFLDDTHIGYVKKEDAKILSPILKTNTFYVKKWGVVSHTPGYMVVQCIIKSKK